jgi:hypothetical protein
MVSAVTGSARGPATGDEVLSLGLAFALGIGAVVGMLAQR